MGLQSGINSLIGTAGAAVTLADLNSSTKSTAKTVKELGVDAKMAEKARKVTQQKLEAIRENQESFFRDRMARFVAMGKNNPQGLQELLGQVRDELK